MENWENPATQDMQRFEYRENGIEYTLEATDTLIFVWKEIVLRFDWFIEFIFNYPSHFK